MFIGSLSTGLLGCPTCVGQNHEDSPPFFSEELYKPDNDESMDELYEQFMKEESISASDKQVAEQTASDSAYPGLQARQATPDKKEAS